MPSGKIDIINIIIPVYNEGENISIIFDEINLKVKTPCCIYIIYDFDEDNTLPAVKNYMEKFPGCIRLEKNRFGTGVLNAIKTGFEVAPHGVILVVMADLSDDLAKVDRMYDLINEGYDIVCGSRYMKGGKQIGGPVLKKFLSSMAGLTLHTLINIPVHDITNSFKMYRKEVLDDIKVESTGGFELGMEIVIKAFFKGYKITEVPSVWRDRTAGKSKFKLFKWLPKYIYWYWYAIKTRAKTFRTISGIL